MNKPMPQFYLAAALIVTISTVYGSCSKSPLAQIAGQWQRTERNETVELRPDRSFSASIWHGVPFSEDLNQGTTYVSKGTRKGGVWTIELGKLVISYSVPVSQRVVLTDQTGQRNQDVLLRYVASKGGNIPTVQMLFRTGSDSKIQVLSEVDGKTVDEWPATGNLGLEVEVNGQWLPLPDAVFKVASVDSGLRQWHGALVLSGSLDVTEKGTVLAYVLVGDQHDRFVVFQATLVGAQLSILGPNIGSMGGLYSKRRK